MNRRRYLENYGDCCKNQACCSAFGHAFGVKMWSNDISSYTSRKCKLEGNICQDEEKTFVNGQMAAGKPDIKIALIIVGTRNTDPYMQKHTKR